MNAEMNHPMILKIVKKPISPFNKNFGIEINETIVINTFFILPGSARMSPINGMNAKVKTIMKNFVNIIVIGVGVKYENAKTMENGIAKNWKKRKKKKNPLKT
jgi:hypothetical protein